MDLLKSQHTFLARSNKAPEHTIKLTELNQIHSPTFPAKHKKKIY